MPSPASIVLVDKQQHRIQIVVAVIGKDWRTVIEGIHERMRQPEPLVPMGTGAYLHVSLGTPIADQQIEIHLYAGALDGALSGRADGLLLAGAAPADVVLAPRLSGLPTAMLAATKARDGWSAHGAAKAPAFIDDDATGDGVAALKAVTKGVLHRLLDEGAIQPPH